MPLLLLLLVGLAVVLFFNGPWWREAHSLDQVDGWAFVLSVILLVFVLQNVGILR